MKTEGEMQQERKNVSTHTSDLPAFLSPVSCFTRSFQFLKCKFFPRRVFAYVIFSVQNGLYALIEEDLFLTL